MNHPQLPTYGKHEHCNNVTIGKPANNKTNYQIIKSDLFKFMSNPKELSYEKIVQSTDAEHDQSKMLSISFFLTSFYLLPMSLLYGTKLS